MAEALSAEARERTGVGALKRRLVRLQAEVGAAHARLRATQARHARQPPPLSPHVHSSR